MSILFFCSALFRLEVAKSEINDPFFISEKQISTSYLDSKNELEDYIIGAGDGLFIEFYPALELSGLFTVNEEGEVYLPRLNEVNVSGLTTSELEKLLEENYAEFLITPTVKIKIAVFKESKVIVTGEVRYPGSYLFPSYISASAPNFLNAEKESQNIDIESKYSEDLRKFKNSNRLRKNYFQNENILNDQYTVGKDSRNTKNISDVIRKAGGITSSSDLSRVKVIRRIPLGKGGGKKVAVLNLNEFLSDHASDNNLRIFDGDRIFIPSLKNKNVEQVAKSVVTGLSPRFVEVNVYGRVQNPGTFKLPLEGTLSDAIDITGPIKPLSGKVVLIRYKSDGSIQKEKISYSAKAPRGSKRNPFIKEGDLITVTNSVLGKTSGVIQEITAPLQGIYFTKELIDNF
ncbi:polysaccharide biosynthesis/export family protein [Prochlorococcus sp. MIT 0604]|uniref:polysaccharide biosynthesis/export family protein n=1 Tax=Prochlorococcus sp. MIT 0604 TaxID=1501268 RepID=UPI001CEC403B|nr:polysaccharide biosynthesis/export family protein [Prochlorococcus sp. MIT 0604]